MHSRFRRLHLEPLEERCCPDAPTPAANFDKLGAYRPSDGSWSLDANGDGHFGRFNLTTSGYYAFGTTSHNPFLGTPNSGQDIRAFFAAAEPSMDFD